MWQGILCHIVRRWSHDVDIAVVDMTPGAGVRITAWAQDRGDPTSHTIGRPA